MIFTMLVLTIVVKSFSLEKMQSSNLPYALVWETLIEQTDWIKSCTSRL